jgi:hypothetical protein
MKSLFILFLIITANLFSQVFLEKDLEIFNSKIQFAQERNLKDLPFNKIISEIGKSFISTPYEAHTLEISDEEELIVNLRQLDCTTFLETTFALSLCVKNEKTTFEDFQFFIKQIRYREGLIKSYPSRLHYFSDWIYDNQRKNLIKDVTKELGGKQVKFNVNFMSKNPHLYKHLKNNPDFVQLIRQQEKEIAQREYHFIPENKILSIDDKIKEGDFIAITTNISGLDIGHVGIAVKGENGKTFFLHAPQVGSFVQITKETLADYIKKSKKHTGILVLRPN